MENSIGLITGNEIRNKTYSENEYIVDGLIKGDKVSILTGGSKTGKSTLALQMAYSISKGIPFLDHETKKCEVLYICLDNEEDLIAERLKLMHLEMDDSVIFCFNKRILLNEDSFNEDSILLLEVISETLEKHPSLRLVVIDLFDNIRNLTFKTEANNVKDSEDMEMIKGIANMLKVHILLLNHDTKSGIQNGYCSSKGGVKLVGSCNGTYLHLIRNGIGETNATLEVGGRNIKEEILNLNLDTSTMTYSLNEENANEDMPYEVGMIRNFIIRNNGYSGTISNLLQLTRLPIATNRASRLLNTHKALLESEGITFSIDPSRTNGRIYTFLVNEKDDKDDTLCI